MPKHIEIRRDGLGAYITVDGEDLPADWFSEACVHLGHDLTPKVTLTMLAESVEVHDIPWEARHGPTQEQDPAQASG